MKPLSTYVLELEHRVSDKESKRRVRDLAGDVADLEQSYRAVVALQRGTRDELEMAKDEIARLRAALKERQ
jgi:hypothetical protein